MTKKMMSDKQSDYLLRLINKATGNNYRFLSQVKEDGIGKRCGKVRGISGIEASTLITEWENKQ